MPLTRPRRGPLPSPHLRGEGQGEGLDVIAVNNFGYAWDFSFLWAYRGLILMGLGVTIAYTIGTILLGLIVGLITGLLRLSRNPLLTAPLIAYVEIFRCTPLLVQIVWFYYALPVVLGIDIPAHVAATLVLSLYTGAFYAEIIRGGVQSINKGQIEAGYALGLHKLLVFRLIVLKPALRAIFPSLVSQFVLLTLTTSIASAVSAYELTSVAKRIESDSFRSFEVYSVVTLMYLAISWMVMHVLNFISSRYLSYPVR